MNKTMKKVFVAVMTIVMVMVALVPVCFAENVLDPSNLTGNVNSTAQNKVRDIGSRLLGTLQAIGAVLAVVILAVLGIKYMMGSAEEKADYKKSMIPYIVGAAILGLAPTIAGMVFNFFK